MTAAADVRERESVLCDLASPDEDVRRLAVERAFALPPEQAIPQLVERLGDPSWRVRKVAVERLAAGPAPEQAARALVLALGDGENPGRRNAAVEALVRCGPRAVVALLAAIAGPDPDVRKLVVDVLAQIGDARAAAPLVQGLEDPDANVRAAAADALVAVPGAGVGAALLRSATRAGEDPLVRFAALRTLAGLEVAVAPDVLGSALSDATLRPAALLLLGRSDDAAGSALLLKALAERSRPSREAAMRALLSALSRADGERADRLVAQIREVVAANPGWVATHAARLARADLPTRLLLVQFLGLVAAPEAALPILCAARDEALAEVCLATLEAMGEPAESALAAAFGEQGPEERLSACALFGTGRSACGAARLLSALDDPSAPVRAAAARAAGRRRLDAALPQLVRRLELAALDDPLEAEEEALAVCEALVALAGPEADPARSERAVALLASRLPGAPEGVRLAIACALGAIGRPADSGLVASLLKDPAASVRRAAVCALARLVPGSVAEPLRLALADESAAVRCAAARALGDSRSDAVLSDLAALAEDDDALVRAAAVRALGLRFAASPDASLRERVQVLLDEVWLDEVPVALAAAEALREVGGAAAARGAALLAREEPELLREGIRCAGSAPALARPEALLALVSHPDWSVRAEAIGTLAARRVARAVPSILRRLEVEQDGYVRQVILQALERLEG
jgi:HEAT repeat protein